MSKATKSEIEIKPTTFANGVPKEEHNGYFGDGLAERILALLDADPDQQLTAVVKYKLDDTTRKGKGVRYPILIVQHIEPIWDQDEVAAADEILQAAYKKRTGADQLDFSGVAEGGE